MRDLALAAFEPFGGRHINRAERAARLLDGERIEGRAVRTSRLATAFATLRAQIAALLETNPEALLLVGESAHARCLIVETVALNIASAELADNRGEQPIDRAIDPQGPLALRVPYDAHALTVRAQSLGAACAISHHAGTFCCNAALYHALSLTDGTVTAPTIAFVHVPARFPWAGLWVSDQRAAQGLRAILRALISR